MLKNIPSVLSPLLLKTLMEMGCKDEIVPGDTCGTLKKGVVR